MRKLLKLLLIIVTFVLVVVALAVIGLSVMNSVQLDTLLLLSAGLDRWFWSLTLLRVLIIVGIYLAWPSIMRRLSRRGQWSEAQTMLMTDSRTKLVLMMIALDVVIVQLPHYLK